MPLTNMLLEQGHKVHHLSRSASQDGPVPTFQWDIEAKTMDPKALKGVEHIIHLAGAGIADKPWTAKRKQEIVDSRVESAELLRSTCEKEGIKLKSFISASAIGWYPLEISDKTFTEDEPAANGFLGEVCSKWEAAADKFEDISSRVVKLRIGLVLCKGRGALKQIELPVRYYAAAGLGTGEQAMSWIHLTDVCRMFIHSLDNNLKGVYNAVGPDTITNQDFMQILSDVMERPMLLPNVPEFVIKMIFGGKAELVLKGVKLSASKIQKTGFAFDYPTLNSALMHIYN